MFDFVVAVLLFIAKEVDDGVHRIRTKAGKLGFVCVLRPLKCFSGKLQLLWTTRAEGRKKPMMDYEKQETVKVGEWTFSLGILEGANSMPEISALNARTGEAVRFKARQNVKVPIVIITMKTLLNSPFVVAQGRHIRPQTTSNDASRWNKVGR